MKKIVAITVFLLSVLLFAGCAAKGTVAPEVPASPAPAATLVATSLPKIEHPWDILVREAIREGKVNIYAADFLGDTGNAISKAFKDKYGITVELVSGTSAALTERVKTEQRMGQSLTDVVEAASTNIAGLKADKFTQPYGDLPVFQAKDVWYIDPKVDPEWHILRYAAMLVLPYVNIKLVKPGEEPKSWADLLKPQWKGKMGVASPVVVTAMDKLRITMIGNKVLDNDYFQELGKHDVNLAPSSMAAITMLVRGDVSILLVAPENLMNNFIEEGASIKPLDLAEGSRAGGSLITQAKNSPHPSAARLFMNWFLSPEGQVIHGKFQRLLSIRKDVEDFRPPAARLVPKKVFLETIDVAAAGDKAFRDQVVSNMWNVKGK